MTLPKRGSVPYRIVYSKMTLCEQSMKSRCKDHVVKEQEELAPPTENSTGVFYLPHHAVKKERRGKIKWRIVFDASFRDYKRPSLNDVLEMSPNLIHEVLATLLRFRRHPVAIIGDILQAFLQLSLDRKNRDITRFLWYRISKDDKGNRYTTL